MLSAIAISDLILSRDPGIEVIMTGRTAPRELVRVADLVRDMIKRKNNQKKIITDY